MYIGKKNLTDQMNAVSTDSSEATTWENFIKVNINRKKDLPNVVP